MAPVVWLTGLSGAGKTTLSDGLAAALRAEGVAVLQLDGDILRRGLNRGLGFDAASREENVRRCAEIARIVSEQEIVAICALISPLAHQRAMAATIVGPAWREVYVKCSIEKAIERDPKGLYARALRGEIADFTGIGSPYEAPLAADLEIDTEALDELAACRLLTDAVRGWKTFTES